MRIETGKILPELASGRWQPEGLTEGEGAQGPSTMLRMVPLPQASWGRII
jgi:hypothetical protein